MKRLIATEIEWDMDEYDDITLPETIEIPEGIINEDEISEYISEQTGYCHKGFTIVNR